MSFERGPSAENMEISKSEEEQIAEEKAKFGKALFSRLSLHGESGAVEGKQETRFDFDHNNVTGEVERVWLEASTKELMVRAFLKVGIDSKMFGWGE